MIPSISEYIEINWNIVVKWPSLREKGSVSGVILVHIFPHLDWIRRDTLRIQSECGKIRTRITLNTDTFYEVLIVRSEVDTLILSWQKCLWYRNQSFDLQSKSIYWFLYDRDLCHERVKTIIMQWMVRCLLVILDDFCFRKSSTIFRNP